MGAFLPFLSVALVGRKINDRVIHTTVHVKGVFIDTMFALDGHEQSCTWIIHFSTYNTYDA